MKKIVGLSVLLLLGTFFLLQATSKKEYRGFVVTNSYDLPDAHCKLVELKHTQSGMQVVHVQNDDPENFFAICFRTHPTKSNGVAHVLEHSVFQGSEKFPIKNVFFHMNKRSLATFMNALTGPDYTAYPASSESPEDFYNLLDVYSDAVFHPLLKKSSFAQEGHRLEFEQFDDPSSPLVYKGVVYNEMKGSLTSPHVRMIKATTEALFPDAMGDVFSGGDPKIIPELTHEEFVQFHKDHYYPGNSLIFFYGNLPLEKHLDFLVEHVCLNQNKKDPASENPLQPLFTAPRYSELSYPTEEAQEEGAIVGISWLTTMQENHDEVLALRVLDHILMGSDSAPLKQHLLASGLCKGVDSGVDANKRQIPFMLYFEGCRPEKAKEIEALVQTTLTRIVQEGLSGELVERTIVQVELEESELKKGKGPVGFSLLHSCAIAKLNRGSAVAGLTLRKQLGNIRDKLEKNPQYFSSIIQKHLLDNPHRVCVVLKPDAELAKNEQEQENQRLVQIREALTQKDIEDILLLSSTLRASDDLPDCLPAIGLEALSKEVPEFPLTQQTLGSLDLFHHPVFTNHITYAALEFALPQIAEEKLWQLGLYTHLLPQLGTKTRGYLDNLNFVSDHTGGIGADVVMRKSENGVYPALRISGKALDRKACVLFDLMADMVVGGDFSDRQRIRQLLIKHASDVEVALKHSALDFATAKTLAFHSVENHVINNLEGLEYCAKIIEVIQNLDSTLDALIVDLQNLQKHILPQQRAHLVLACDKDAYETFYKKQFGALSSLLITQDVPWKPDYTLREPVAVAYHIASPVAFNARGFRTISYNHEDSAYLLLAAELVSTKFLHTRIREQGGAYGAGASYDPATGNFSFKTYRDPSIASSNEAFCEAIDLLCAGNFSETDVQKAKMGILQKLDAPLHPAKGAFLGYQLFCEARGSDKRKAFRTKLLAATASDIQRASSDHLACGFNQSVLVTLASKDICELENKKLATPLISYEVSQCSH